MANGFWSWRVAGGGGNGGGTLVAARRLHNWGADVHVGLGQAPAAMTKAPGRQLDIPQRLGTTGTGAAADLGDLRAIHDGGGLGLILDGLIGHSLKGAPHGLIGELIRLANGSGAPALSLDVPSGVDTTSDIVFDPAIKAAATMTLALPKAGLRAEGVAEQTGALYLADISVPPRPLRRASISDQPRPAVCRERRDPPCLNNRNPGPSG